MVDNPVVSIVIPAYNSRNTVEKTIQSILNIDYPKELTEVIFVDDGSTDNTKNLIEKYLINNQMIYIWQVNKGPAAARNAGIKKARGSIIIFTDSDCEVPEDWVKKIISNFNEDIAAVGGSLKPVLISTKWEAFEQFRREKLYGNIKKTTEALPSCNLAIKKKVLERTGGFDESFKYPSSEDYDLCYRIVAAGYKILYEPAVYVFHNHSQNWRGVLKRAYLHGREGVKLNKKQKQSVLWDIIFAGRLAILPLITAKNYPFKLYLHGFMYELMAILGGVHGIMIYR